MSKFLKNKTIFSYEYKNEFAFFFLTKKGKHFYQF